MSQNQPQELTLEERERTKRQKLIQGWDQLVIKKSCVFIAGVGALGCEIAKDLALAGIGKLMLCDMDTIETSNLSRQMLFYKGDEGRFKAEVAAERLQKMNPFMEIEIFTIPLQKIPMQKYMECQAVVAALDNVQARIDLNTFCLKLGIPLIEGGTVGFEGHVQVIIPESTTTESGKPFPLNTDTKAVEQIFQEKRMNLEEGANSDYYEAQNKIYELEEQIEALRQKHLAPVEEALRREAQVEFEQIKAQAQNKPSTPCYRCVVPVPPPLHDQVAACTLKGIPRTREHCAVKGEVRYIKKHERKPDYDNLVEMEETLAYAQEELEQLRARVFNESIPPERSADVSAAEEQEIKTNIFQTFGGDFALEDMENILGNKIPAIQSVSSIISSIQSQEILKILFLMHDGNVGPIMDPPYINYNGVYGLFEQIEIMKLDDCVACGSRQGQENLTVVLPAGATINDLFRGVQDYYPHVRQEGYIITNPVSKKFLYNPLFERGKTGGRTVEEMEIRHYDEVVFTPISKPPTPQTDQSPGESNLKKLVAQYNVTVQII